MLDFEPDHVMRSLLNKKWLYRNMYTHALYDVGVGITITLPALVQGTLLAFPYSPHRVVGHLAGAATLVSNNTI
jgi:hypothetical protein